MASRRAFSRLISLSTISIAPRSSVQLLHWPAARSVRPRCAVAVAIPHARSDSSQQRRRHSTKPSGGDDFQVYDFAQVNAVVQSPSAYTTTLLDVREPHEYAAGFIPGALNLPITSHPDALFLAPDEFAARFGFKKPRPDAQLLFYCRSGVRSSAAAQMARQAGYKDVVEYRGSWLDWEKNGGEKAGVKKEDEYLGGF